MPPVTMVEARLAALEKEVAALKRQISVHGPNPDWLTRMAGSMQDYPEFEEVLELGRQARQADRPADDDQQEEP